MGDDRWIGRFSRYKRQIGGNGEVHDGDPNGSIALKAQTAMRIP